MKKLLLGGLILGAMSTATYAAREPYELNPRGTVEIGFEWEEFSSSGGKANEDFLLPYVKTKTHFNQTTPYYVEANYTYRHHSDSDKRENDKRKRYELFVGGYEYKNGDFTWKPKVGFRHEEFEDTADRSRTYWRIYPGTSYQLTDRAELFVGGWFAPVSDDRNEGQDETTYKHELEFGVKYKLNNKQVLNTNIFSDYERFERDGSKVKTVNEVQLRIRLDHKFENGKTAAYVFARIGLLREDEWYGVESNKEDYNRRRNRFGVGGSQKLNEDFTVISEVYYQSAKQGCNYDSSGKYDSRKENENKMFVKLGLRYAY